MATAITYYVHVMFTKVGGMASSQSPSTVEIASIATKAEARPSDPVYAVANGMVRSKAAVKQ
jgi:hypothetical protein